MLLLRTRSAARVGGVYIAVLGTSLIVALLGMSALMAQRIQNRMLSTSADIAQAQLNASTAVELALLTMKQNSNWRTSQPNGRWFSNRDTSAGTCSLDVTDPIDSNLANSPDDPVLVRGIGYSGQAEQRVEVTVDSRKEPVSSLRSAIAVGDDINLNSDILWTNGLITAADVDATASWVQGKVEALTVAGSTYLGTTTQVMSDKRPAMPDWNTVFSYYQATGTQLPIGSLPATTPNLGRNVSFDNGTTGWTGTPPGVAAAQIEQENSRVRSNPYSLKVKNRDSWSAGASHWIDDFVKPAQQYTIAVWINSTDVRTYCITIYTKGTGGSVQSNSSLLTVAPKDSWTQLTATLAAPSWTGNLEYAFVKIAGADVLSDKDFFLDDFSIYETTTGRFINRKVLSPSVNTIYAGAPINAQGLYWIDCQGARLIIERSRIQATLLVLNPGPNSCVAEGPINWAPAMPGYPALLVNATDPTTANFSLRATNRPLSEAKNEINYNPGGAPYDFANALCTPTDTAANDIYPSEICGLIVVRNDLTFQNTPLIRGQVIVGDDIAASSGAIEVQYVSEPLLNPPPGFLAPYSYLRRPASARKVVLP
jgi:hypothetical protein